jgi:ketosteroid isomerase-like protein
MYADKATEAEILAAADEFFGLLANGRAEAADCFLDEEDAALHGSEAGESLIGREAIRAFLASLFAKAGPVRFSFRERRVSVSGAVAWFTSAAEVTVGGATVPYRVTGILERRDGRWRWRLFSGSEPARDRT